MVDYTIFALDESDLTLSGGVQLDGVTQGDGSHLMGATLTLNAANWTPIDITDNDPNFQDSDTSQVLNGAQEIAGTTYASGTVVEAEYSFVVSDGTNSWTLVGFNVNNSSPVFGTVEGIAVIGGPGGFPPIGVPLTVTSTQEGPSFPSSSYATPICFAAGTLIDTPSGPCPVEHLGPGDLVTTHRHGAEPLIWTGMRKVMGIGPFAPVRIRRGILGTTRDLLVSQQHRLLIDDWRVPLLFGETKVLVAAKHLVDGRTVTLEPMGPITYVHLLLKHHRIVRSNGAQTERLLPGPTVYGTVHAKDRAGLLAATPGVATSVEPAAVAILKRHEAMLLTALPSQQVA